MQPRVSLDPFVRGLRSVTVEPVLFLYMLSTFMQYSVFQDFVYVKVCVTKYDHEVCSDLYNVTHKEQLDYVQESSSHWIMWSTIASIIIGYYLGSWSDRFGRELPVFLPPESSSHLVMWSTIALTAPSIIIGYCLGSWSDPFGRKPPIFRSSESSSHWIMWSTIALTIPSIIIGYDPGAIDLVESSSHWIMWSTIALTVPSIIIGYYLGSWSDRFGRKLPIFLPSVGGALSMLVYTVMASDFYIPVYYILLGSFLGGVFGGFIITIMAVMSYIASITTEENRTTRVAIVESMIFVGGTIGPFIGGTLLGKIGHAWVFVICMACYVVLIIYACVCIKEVRVDVASSRDPIIANEEKPPLTSSSSTIDAASADTASTTTGVPSTTTADTERTYLRRERRKLAELPGKYFGCSHLIETVRTVTKERPRQQRKYIFSLLVAATLNDIVVSGENDVTYLFIKDRPLMLEYKTYSYYFGVRYGLCSLMLLIGLPIARRFNMRDTTLGVIGSVSRIAGFIVLGLSTTRYMFYSVAVISMLSAFCLPSIRSLLSKMVEPSEQGKLFSMVAALESTSLLVASVIFNSVYPATRHYFKGFVFEMAAVIMVVPLLIMLWLHWQLSSLRSYPVNDRSQVQPHTGGEQPYQQQQLQQP